ncbi:MAG: UDP-N-acetylmuramoyl-L-alanyl-D-glutamate--2,6-diaminopimelate ligase [Candidatus Adlerbacteria bacterium]|nr:UDP-N-acetylmuramoyl-L-alanyl-D-glutamate--2,6-diaminopimelate ligase [Candidatus Adlerbacteria bacterium]
MRKYIPKKVLDLYHLLFAYGGAFLYRFPSKKLFVVGVTGTKGKSTTSELIRTVLAGAGHKVALASTIQFKIGTESEPNLFKMTMPGRAYLQKFLRKAVDAGCTHAVIEMTSEGAKQFRHKGIELDALVFTNLAPEHIESHGSLEAYAAAKLSLAKHLEESPKRPRYIVANADDAYGKQFLAAKVEVRAPFSLRDAEPYTADDTSVRFMFKKGQLFSVPLPGLFSLKNILATITLGDAIGIRHDVMRKTLEHIPPVAGRAEPVESGQDFSVIVDYAHTPDSLRALFETYKGKNLICVMGSTGGGRDQWKRPLMGTIADELCSHIFLTNEDPYDEDPKKIIADIAAGFTVHKPEIILDRRTAIAAALRRAKKGSVVAITGKGTDPYIMGARGSKLVWSDKRVAEEELDKLLGATS